MQTARWTHRCQMAIHSGCTVAILEAAAGRAMVERDQATWVSWRLRIAKDSRMHSSLVEALRSVKIKRNIKEIGRRSPCSCSIYVGVIACDEYKTHTRYKWLNENRRPRARIRGDSRT